MAALRTLTGRLSGALRTAGPVTILITVLGVAGAPLVLITEFSTIDSVDVLTSGTCQEIADPAARDACQTSGIEQHGGAFILLGLLALLMTVGAGRGPSRPAAAALVAIGIVVLAFALARDLPKTDDTGLVGIQYEEAKAGPGSGLYFEFAGGPCWCWPAACGSWPGGAHRRGRTRREE